MSRQYLAVISDQHITEKGGLLYGLDTNACARGLFQGLEEASLPSLVLSCGDLADTVNNPVRSEATGSPDSYAYARELASQLTKPFLTIPGNHDDPTLMTSFFPSRWQSEAHGVSVQEFNYANLIGIDLRIGAEPTARISQETLEQLDRVLDQSNKAILFTHFPVAELDSPRINETLSLLNRDDLVPLFRKHREKILGCFSGHLHLRYSTELEGVLVEGVPSSSFMFRAEPGSHDRVTRCDDPCGYLMLGVDVDKPLIVRQQYVTGAQRVALPEEQR
jgi:3',5'-cyclic AMP phosphodiesterase CpdA